MASEDNVTYQSRDRVQKVVIQRQAPAKPANGNAVQSKPTAQSAPAADLLPNRQLAASSEASRQPPMPRSSPALQPSPPVPTSLPAPQPLPRQKVPEPPTNAAGTGHRKHKIVRFAAGSTPKSKPRRAEKAADDRHKARKRDALLALADQLDAERADSLAKRQKVRACAVQRSACVPCHAAWSTVRAALFPALANACTYTATPPPQVQGCVAALADGSLPDELAALLKDMAEVHTAVL
jgi:hypothetical protein